MIKYIGILSLFLSTIFGCSVSEDADRSINTIDSIAFENIALNFFCDSLLNNPNLFAADGDDLNIRRGIPFMDSTMYVNGLFKQQEIYYSTIATMVTSPYMDSTEYEYLEVDEIKVLEDLNEYYIWKSKNLDTIRLIDVNSFKKLDWISYSSKLDSIQNTIYLEVYRHIMAEDIAFVQLEFRDADHVEIYFQHNFYFKIDSARNIVDWWVEY